MRISRGPAAVMGDETCERATAPEKRGGKDAGSRKNPKSEDLPVYEKVIQ